MYVCIIRNVWDEIRIEQNGPSDTYKILQSLLPSIQPGHKAVLLHPFILTHKHPVTATFYTHENYNHTLIHTLKHITGYTYYTTSWNH